MQKIFSIIFLSALLDCQDAAKQGSPLILPDTSTIQVVQSDTLPITMILAEKERQIRRKEIEEEERIDSIRLSKVLGMALSYADCYKNKKSFKHDFDMIPEDSSFNVTTSLTFGRLFSQDRKHLLVRRRVPWEVTLNIFLLENNKFKEVHWYPSARCRHTMFTMCFNIIL